MTEQELKQKFELFTAAWRFYRKWAVVPMPFTDDQWQQVIDKTHGICKDFENDDLAVEIMGGIVHCMDKQERKDRNGNAGINK